MKINVSIEANSVEEAQAAFAALAGNAVSTETTKEAVVVQLEPAKAPEKEVEKPKTSRSKTKETVQTDPLAASTPAVQAEPAASVDPLAAAPTSDPLAATPAPAPSDPLAAASTPAATGELTFEQVRAKIGQVATNRRPEVMALVASYKKADGTPCQRPSDLQEKDYAIIYADLDFV